MKKIMMLATILVAGLLFIPNIYAESEIETAENLKTALSTAENNTVTLKANTTITLKASDLPITVNKNVTIEGNGATIKVEDESSVDLKGDKSIITVVDGGDVTINNLTLEGSPKYGLQAYNGGKITIDNVTIKNCKYGAILVNGGDVTVKHLAMANNGTNGGNGIEIGKGENVTQEPKVTLDGTITSDNQNGYITVAENDQLDKFTVESTDTSEEKLQIKDGQVVITNKDGQIIAASNKIKSGVTPQGEEYQEPVTITEQPKEEANPNTSDINLYLLLSLIAVSGVGLTYTVKRRFN